MLLATETAVAEKPAEAPRFNHRGVSRVRPLSTTRSGEHLALTFSLQTAALARLIRRSLDAAKLHKSQLGEKQAFPKLVF
jgi:hypothetical protein